MILSPEDFSKAWHDFAEKTSVQLSSNEVNERKSLIADIRGSIGRISNEILKYPNIAGIAASLKVKGGIVKNIPCVTVLVNKKLSKEKLKNYLIPENISGFPTDIIEAGIPHKLQNFDVHHRPVTPGYSMGHKDITAGTLSGLVKDKNSSEVLFMSNNHVFADVNQGKIGDKILQPGPSDGGSIVHDVVAELVKYKEIVARPKRNKIDVALARPLDGVDYVPDIDGLGVPNGIRKLDDIGVTVQKVGRTTGNTIGIVTALSAYLPRIDFGNMRADFDDCILTEPMSTGGDSGSLILDRDKNIVGLLFAGIGRQGEREINTYVCDIQNVLDDPELNIEMVTTDNLP